jgi:hypothetical protein
VGHSGADGEERNVRGVEEVGVLKRPFLVHGEIAVDERFGFTGTNDAITSVDAVGHKIFGPSNDSLCSPLQTGYPQ